MMRKEPPPIFRLAGPTDRGSLDMLGFTPEQFPFEVRRSRRPDSGILQLQFPSSRRFVEQSPALIIQALARLASREERRSFLQVGESRSRLVLAQMASQLADTGGLPVVGQGGRITLYGGSEWMEADVVVRKRIGWLPSTWRSAEQIFRRISQQIAGETGDVEVWAQFGYLELSKYERQLWLRPVFIFVLQGFGMQDFRVPWQEAMVEVATVNEEIRGDEGLGSWSSQH